MTGESRDNVVSVQCYRLPSQPYMIRCPTNRVRRCPSFRATTGREIPPRRRRLLSLPALRRKLSVAPQREIFFDKLRMTFRMTGEGVEIERSTHGHLPLPTPRTHAERRRAYAAHVPTTPTESLTYSPDSGYAFQEPVVFPMAGARCSRRRRDTATYQRIREHCA